MTTMQSDGTARTAGERGDPTATMPAAAARPSALDPQIASRLKRDDKGLVAAVVQQYDSGRVLMVGYMDDEALRRTLATGRVTFWSRSRQEYWRKGDTSGHSQYVKSVALDCDGDAILVQVDQVGAACHTGDYSCFDAGGLLPSVEGHRTAEQETVPDGPGAPPHPAQVRGQAAV